MSYYFSIVFEIHPKQVLNEAYQGKITKLTMSSLLQVIIQSWTFISGHKKFQNVLLKMLYATPGNPFAITVPLGLEMSIKMVFKHLSVHGHSD